MRTDSHTSYPKTRAGHGYPMPLVQHVQAMRSYRATLVPAGATPSDVEVLADAGLLPTISVKAASAVQAEANAHLVSGKAVLRVERVEG